MVRPNWKKPGSPQFLDVQPRNLNPYDGIFGGNFQVLASRPKFKGGTEVSIFSFSSGASTGKCQWSRRKWVETSQTICPFYADEENKPTLCHP